MAYNYDSWGQRVKISKDGSFYILARSYPTNAHYCVVKYVKTVRDVGVSSIISPDSGIVSGQFYPITAMINNYGNTSENFSVYAAVYDSTTDSLLFSDTTSVNLGSLSNDTARLDSFYYEPNHSYKTVVYVNLPDTNASNDTQFVYTHAVTTVDVGVSSIISPDSGIVNGQYYPITAMINNYGNTSETFNVYSAVYDSTSLVHLDSSNINLNAFSDSVLNIDSFDYELNHRYKTVVYVNLPDTNASNDTQFIYTTPKHFEVLFVEDAEGHGAPYNPDSTWYIPIVNILGSDSLYWYGPTTDESENGPSLAKMKAADLVIWNAYDDYNAPCFTEEDTANINEYLAGGGKIWIVGQDIYYSLYSSIKGIKSGKRNSERNVVRTVDWIGRVFGVDSVHEDYLGY
ncbi:MAG: hypothetical protein GWP03_07240, partial [Proteobacteria bacterium]|nr:hypothetical protein [Pseudomonadota bacterium]